MLFLRIRNPTISIEIKLFCLYFFKINRVVLILAYFRTNNESLMKLKISLYNRYCKCYRIIGLTIIALIPLKSDAQVLDSLKAVLKNDISISEKAKIYNKTSNIYLDIDLYKSRAYADSAIHLGKELKDYKVLSNAYVNYANAFYFEGNLDSTLYFYQKSYDEIIKTNDENEIAASMNRLGLVYEAKSNYSEATQYYYQALKIYEKTNDQLGLANIYNNLGVVNDVNGDIPKSIIYYTKALGIFKEINDIDGQANVYNNLATLYAEDNKLGKAISYIKTSIEILKKHNSKSATASAYFNASNFYDIKGDSDSARQMLDSAYLYYTFTNNSHGIANVLDQEAFYFEESANYNDAISLLHESLEIRGKVGNLNATAGTIQQLSNTYSKNGDYKLALQFFKEFKALEDSIFNINTHKAISEISIKYETSKKDQAISLLKKESEIKQFQNEFLIFLSISFGVISLLFLYSFRTKSKYLKSQKEAMKHRDALVQLEKEQQKNEKILLEKEIKTQQKINELQKNELEHSKRELATSAMQILNKNKTLSEIKTSILNLSPTKAEEKIIIEKISDKVMDNINLDEDWEQFKIHFEKVNTNFFEKLQTEYPKLTAGDLKVCAYIKINLSSKEIAQMMNISIDGINKRLYRIRKKINLPTDINLGNYLVNY